MPQCCPDSTQYFINAATTDVAWGGATKPLVTIMYLIAGVWTQAGVFTSIQLVGSPVTSVHIDHGGPATGIVKLS